MSQTATEPRTFSESELAVLVADGIKRETAALMAERDEAKAALAGAQNKLDAALVAQKAAEDAKTAAEAKAEEIKVETEKAAERAARKDDRVKKMREVAKHVTDEDFFTDEGRLDRVSAMDDAEFDGYLGDLRVAAGKAAAPSTAVPRQTAMEGSRVEPEGKTGTAPASAAFLGRRFNGDATKS